MDSELSIEVGEGVETVGVVEAALVLAVAALHLAVVTRGVRPDEFVAYAEVSGGLFKESNAAVTRGIEPVGELKAIVGLDALRDKPLPFEERISFLQKVR